MRVVVTGATGYVGRTLVPQLVAGGHDVIAPTRREADLAEPAGFRPFLERADALIHLAAYNPPRWHRHSQDRQRFRLLNVEATAILGRLALEAGIRSFIFLSSARVYGIQDIPAYDENTPPRPEDAYGSSKWQAEQALAAVFASVPGRLLVLRAPVIYGPDRGGIFGLVGRFARAGLPFPACFAEARKSVLYAGNLASTVRHALDLGKAVSGTFNICDGEPVTLGELGAIAAGMRGRRFRTFTLPRLAVRAALAMPVFGPIAAHLASPCVLDCRRFPRAFGWRPVLSTHEAAARAFSAETITSDHG